MDGDAHSVTLYGRCSTSLSQSAGHPTDPKLRGLIQAIDFLNDTICYFSDHFRTQEQRYDLALTDSLWAKSFGNLRRSVQSTSQDEPLVTHLQADLRWAEDHNPDDSSRVYLITVSKLMLREANNELKAMIDMDDMNPCAAQAVCRATLTLKHDRAAREAEEEITAWRVMHGEY